MKHIQEVISSTYVVAKKVFLTEFRSHGRGVTSKFLTMTFNLFLFPFECVRVVHVARLRGKQARIHWLLHVGELARRNAGRCCPCMMLDVWLWIGWLDDGVSRRRPDRWPGLSRA